MRTELDPVRLSVLASRFDGIARKMSNTLLRTGRSGVLNRAKDFSCCIVTAGGELLVTGESLPIHVLSGPDLMARSMMAFHPRLNRGDAFLHNSPYHGCSHAADLSILVPVVDAQGIHRMTVVAKAHQADIGNSQPTTYMGDAVDLYHEGALIFPAVAVQRDHADIEDIIRMCEMRIRVPEQWRGDYLATLGAARIGEQAILELASEVGWEELERFTAAWFDYSERRMRAAVAALPAGAATACSTHDPLPGTPDEGVPIRASISIDPADEQIIVDLTDNPDCMPCGLNLSEACARTAALIGVFNSLDPTIPKNAGSCRRVEVRLRENCIAGIPRHPASCSAATTNISDRVANATQSAFAAIADGIGMAEVGAVTAPSDGVISGWDRRTGRAFVNQVFLGSTGGAATAAQDAWLTVSHVGNGGVSFIDGVELDELYHPILIHERELVVDTEGAGSRAGAPSLRVIFGPTLDPIDVAYVADGHHNPARGVRGGLGGGPSDQHVRRVDGSHERLPACAQVRLEPGDLIVSIGAGGGGYGPPVERDMQAVAEAVLAGLVSRERARAVYHVVVTENGLDKPATGALRAGVRTELAQHVLAGARNAPDR